MSRMMSRIVQQMTCLLAKQLLRSGPYGCRWLVHCSLHMSESNDELGCPTIRKEIFYLHDSAAFQAAGDAARDVLARQLRVAERPPRSVTCTLSRLGQTLLMVSIA